MKKRVIILIALCLAFTAYSGADEVKIPVGSQATMGVDTPAHGMTKNQVEASFGPPDSRQGPIGDPPIYFWEYPDFTVYFESDRVIHTVSKHIPVSQ